MTDQKIINLCIFQQSRCQWVQTLGPHGGVPMHRATEWRTRRVLYSVYEFGFSYTVGLGYSYYNYA